MFKICLRPPPLPQTRSARGLPGWGHWTNTSTRRDKHNIKFYNSNLKTTSDDDSDTLSWKQGFLGWVESTSISVDPACLLASMAAARCVCVPICLKENYWTPFSPVHTGPRHLNDMSVKSLVKIRHGSSTAALSVPCLPRAALRRPVFVSVTLNANELLPADARPARRQAAMTTVFVVAWALHTRPFQHMSD